MGVDLKLLVVGGRDGANTGFSHSMFEFGRCHDIYPKLDAKARTIPGFKLSGYVARVPDGSFEGESCYGVIEQTPYGIPLTYVSAKEFCDCAASLSIQWPEGMAAIAYLKCLPPDTLVGLYYH